MMEGKDRPRVRGRAREPSGEKKSPSGRRDMSNLRDSGVCNALLLGPTH